MVWSEPVGSLESGDAHAVFTAFSVTDPNSPGSQLRGVRVNLEGLDWKSVVYIEESEVAAFKKRADWLAKAART